MERLKGDLRSLTARAAMSHFKQVVEFVERTSAGAVVPLPPEPMAAVVITAPPNPTGVSRPPELASRYRWALEWLSTRRFVVPKGLRVEWRVRRGTPPAGMRALDGGRTAFDSGD